MDRLRDRLSEIPDPASDELARDLQARVLLDEVLHFGVLVDTTGRLLEATRTALEAGGIGRVELIGAPVWEAPWFRISPETRQRVEDTIHRVAETGELVRCDLEVYGSAHGSETIPIDLSVKPVRDSAGRIVFLVLEGRDVSAERRVQRTKAELFAAISHELRTPTTVVLGRIERLLTDERLPPDAVESVRRVGDNARMLLGWVGDLAEVASLERGDTDVHPRPVDLAGRVRRIVADFESATAAEAVTFELEVPADLLVRVDVDLVESVVSNLVADASMHVPADGTIRLVLQVQHDDELLIEVADSGPGVPPEERERIFEPFHAGHRHRSRQRGGAGLRLAIVRRLADLLGGSAEVTDSDLGGPCVLVRVPCEPVDAPAVAEEPPGAEVGSSGRADAVAAAHRLRAQPVPDQPPHAAGGAVSVLLVEDNPDLARFILEELGAELAFTVAVDGVDALERLQAGLEPEVIVTDVALPRLSGDELIRTIRADPELPQAPVLVLSAQEDRALREELLAHGANDYVVKPVSSAELHARIRNLATPARLNRKLRSANEALSRYATQLSHDVRTPLTTIVGAAETLLRQGEQLTADERRLLLRGIASNARRLSGIAEDLFDDVRGRDVVTAVDVQEVFEQARALLQRPAEEVGATIVAPKRLPRVMASRGAVMQVMTNLISNALTHRDPDHAPHITVTAEPLEGMWQVSVADEGRGIPPQDHERVFGLGERGDDPAPPALPGAGLGLHACRQAVERHGGRIWIAQHEGPGATVRFTLPMVEEDGE